MEWRCCARTTFKYCARIKPGLEIPPRSLMEERPMVWTAPKLEEICLGMEINMYYPADDREDDLF